MNTAWISVTRRSFARELESACFLPGYIQQIEVVFSFLFIRSSKFGRYLGYLNFANLLNYFCFSQIQSEVFLNWIVWLVLRRLENVKIHFSGCRAYGYEHA